MQLQKLLTQELTKLKPEALIIIYHQDRYTAQKVVYAPEILNLGVVLLGYYFKPTKVAKLSQLGDCLSVAHYLSAPRTLKYGRDFVNNKHFKRLPTKLQKHLTGEIQDCTMSFTRDFNLSRPSSQFSQLTNCLKINQEPYVYLYQNHRWQILRINGRKVNSIDLRIKITQLLSKKA